MTMFSYYQRCDGSYAIIDNTLKAVCDHLDLSLLTFSQEKSSLNRAIRINVAPNLLHTFWTFSRRQIASGFLASSKLKDTYGTVPTYTGIREGFGFACMDFPIMVHLSMGIPPMNMTEDPRNVRWDVAVAELHKQIKTSITVWDKYTTNLLKDHGYNAHYTPLLIWDELPNVHKDKEFDILMNIHKYHIMGDDLKKVIESLSDYKILIKNYPPKFDFSSKIGTPSNVTFVDEYLDKNDYYDLLSRCKVYLQYVEPTTEVFGIRVVEAGYFMPVLYVDNGATPYMKEWAYTVGGVKDLRDGMDGLFRQYDDYMERSKKFTAQYVLDNVLECWSPLISDFCKDDTVDHDVRRMFK